MFVWENSCVCNNDDHGIGVIYWFKNIYDACDWIFMFLAQWGRERPEMILQNWVAEVQSKSYVALCED